MFELPRCIVAISLLGYVLLRGIGGIGGGDCRTQLPSFGKVLSICVYTLVDFDSEARRNCTLMNSALLKLEC
jgi:hypothetical protein